MANIKISELSSHSGSNLHTSDLLPIVDLDANNDGSVADAQTKSINIAEFKTGIFASPTFTGAVTIDSVSPPSSTASPSLAQHLTNKTYVDLALTVHTSLTNNPHSVTKAQVGLGSVDNTTDAAKPVSTAQQTALDLKANRASPVFTGSIDFSSYTSASIGTVAASIDPAQNNIPAAGAGNDTTTDLAVDQTGNVVRTTQEATWLLTRAEIDALTTSTSAGLELIQAPGANKFVIIEKVTFLIKYAYNNGTMATSQQYEILQDGNAADEIAVIKAQKILDITKTGQSASSSDIYGIYEHDTGFATLNRAYKPNVNTTIRRKTTSALATAVESISIKMRYRVYDVASY